MAEMTHLLTLFVLFLMSTVSTADEVDESCFELFDPEEPEQECCETDFETDDEVEYEEDFSDCPTDFSTDEGKCDTIKCYYKHDGVWKDDDIDDEAVKTKLQSIDSKNPPAQRAAERILKHCLNGKYMKYGTDDACPAMKYFLCSYINTVVECDSWNKTETCAKHSEYASKCKVSLG
ncbi:uncharacterized protein LOC116779700 [Danaus plexippus]|uniref:Uncharacterized protein n=1 Tax=Danaus plexippus plexippus TaxID=278856 RepID=A0A212F3R6_DANPL|nr:uncharacterized protein LOC116779700 [Danaus plexippus]OWR48375.1 hypothetical protein KGM_201299 [Danaus plexippus plexippus]